MVLKTLSLTMLGENLSKRKAFGAGRSHGLGLTLLFSCLILGCGSQDASSDASSSIKDPFKEALEAQNSAQNSSLSNPQSNSQSNDSAPTSSPQGQVYSQSSAGTLSTQPAVLGSSRAFSNVNSNSSSNSNSNGVTPTPGQDPFKAFLEAHPNNSTK